MVIFDEVQNFLNGIAVHVNLISDLSLSPVLLYFQKDNLHVFCMTCEKMPFKISSFWQSKDGIADWTRKGVVYNNKEEGLLPFFIVIIFFLPF